MDPFLGLKRAGWVGGGVRNQEILPPEEFRRHWYSGHRLPGETFDLFSSFGPILNGNRQEIWGWAQFRSSPIILPIYVRKLESVGGRGKYEDRPSSVKVSK